jgi:uncharacterized protein YdeI (YjbR/CyaY-like superfamily)
MAESEQVHPETREAWRAWLERHHARANGVWLVSWKKHTERPAIPYDDAVCEALCFGWVDSKPRRIDDDRTALWFSPRRRGSAWSRPNNERVARMEAVGRMAEAGRAAVEAAKADGTWSMLDTVEDLAVPPDLTAALAGRPGAREHFDGFPRSTRRAILEWIVQEKRPETRAERIGETARLAERGERANQWRRPA